MEKPDNELSFEKLRLEVMSRYNNIVSQPQVSQEEQEIELNYQSRMTRGERFFFVVDLFKFEISHCTGLQRWMGYSDKDFTYKRYWTLLHPSSQKSVMLISQQLYQNLGKGMYQLGFMVQRFSSRVAIKHYDGHYVLAKKVSSVFQYDQQNRLLSYINEFTIVGPFNGESLEPNFYNDLGREDQKGNEVMADVVRRFREMKVFSARELQLARVSFENPDSTRKEIAELMGVKPDTIGTFSNRFVEKARKYFKVDFANTQEAAAFLGRNGLIEYDLDS